MHLKISSAKRQPFCPEGRWVKDLSCEIVIRLMSQALTDYQLTLVQVMAWCCQATSHYLNQCWPSSMMPYSVTRPQWVNSEDLCTKTGIGAWISNYMPQNTVGYKHLSLPWMRIFKFKTYVEHTWIITSDWLLWHVITYPCPRHLFSHTSHS